jgi:hypothetical protein
LSRCPAAVTIWCIELLVIEAGDRGFDEWREVAYLRDLALTLLNTEHWHETQKTTSLAPRLNRPRLPLKVSAVRNPPGIPAY